MDRIEHETATPDRLFTEGDPAVGTPATVVTDDWCNGLQGELLAIIEAAGITPDKADWGQVLEALQILFAAKAHAHTIPDVSGLQTALDLRSLVGHLHAIADVTGLQAALDARSLVGHLHDDLYAASLLVQAGQLLLKSRSGATLSTVDLSPLPVGTVICHAAATPPAGFLECNGAAVSRATYAALYAVIGTTYGAGDGSTTFGLPDLRGEFVRGWDHGRGVDAGRSFGAAQADELRSHYHRAMDYTDGKHAVLSNGAGPTEDGYTPQLGANTYPVLYTGSAGGSETRPRNVALLYVIKF